MQRGGRGLDTQGNIIFAGLRASSVRKLMIGKISNITGQCHNPRYETLALQAVLAPRHSGWARGNVLGGRTLLEHCQMANPNGDIRMTADMILNNSRYTMDVSKHIMVDLGFISFDAETNRYIPNPEKQISYATLAVTWHLRGKVWESISVGLCLADIIEEFSPSVREGVMALSERKMLTDRIK